MAAPSSSAVRALALEYKSLQDEPVEGFKVRLLNDDDMFQWEVALFGPPQTLYEGAYFKVTHRFLDILNFWGKFVLQLVAWERTVWLGLRETRRLSAAPSNLSVGYFRDTLFEGGYFKVRLVEYTADTSWLLTRGPQPTSSMTFHTRAPPSY